MSGITGHDYRLAYGMTFEVSPEPHEFIKVDRSDDLCRRCGKGELHHIHVRHLKKKRQP